MRIRILLLLSASTTLTLTFCVFFIFNLPIELLFFWSFVDVVVLSLVNSSRFGFNSNFVTRC